MASYEEFCDYVVANHHEIILEYEMTKLSTQPQMSPAEIDALSAEAVEDFLSKFLRRNFMGHITSLAISKHATSNGVSPARSSRIHANEDNKHVLHGPIWRVVYEARLIWGLDLGLEPGMSFDLDLDANLLDLDVNIKHKNTHVSMKKQLYIELYITLKNIVNSCGKKVFVHLNKSC